MFTEMSTIIALRRRTAAGIVAVTYQAGRRRAAIRLPDGSIVEIPTPDQRSEAPDRVEASVGVAADGTPATIHHAQLGLVAAHVALTGVYLLPSGEVAAVYGAEAEPLG